VPLLPLSWFNCLEQLLVVSIKLKSGAVVPRANIFDGVTDIRNCFI
jgi:hypothetical protein